MSERLPAEVQRLGAAVARAAQWFVRAARAGIVVGLLVGAAVFLVIAAGGIVDGLALVVAAVVCLVPAGAFALLWWRARLVIRDAGHLPEDMRLALTRLKETPRQIVDGVSRIESQKGVVRRLRTLHGVVGALRDLDPAESAVRERFERLYVTLGTMAPAAAVAVGGVMVGALAVPVLALVAVVT